MKKYFSYSSEQTMEIAKKIALTLPIPTLIVFEASMGAGKTTFCRGLAMGIDCDTNEVSSPTFAIVHYHDGKTPFIHFDMDRIHTLEDLETTGFFDYINMNALIAVEWGENIQDWLPKTYMKISILITGQDTREIICEEIS